MDLLALEVALMIRLHREIDEALGEVCSPNSYAYFIPLDVIHDVLSPAKVGVIYLPHFAVDRWAVGHRKSLTPERSSTSDSLTKNNTKFHFFYYDRY